MGFRIDPRPEGADLVVWIRYSPAPNRLLAWLGGRMYAQWCVNQMRDAAVSQFGPVPAAASAAGEKT